MPRENEERPVIDELALEGGIEQLEAVVPIIPLLIPVSGLYTAFAVIHPPTPLPIPRPLPRPLPVHPGPIGPGGASGLQEYDEASDGVNVLAIPIPILREELRLDVDGRYPQMTASGVIRSTATTRLHWVAKVQPSGLNTWSGAIWYKDGNAALLPQTFVRINAVRSIFPNQRRATVTFTGGGSTRVRTFQYASPYFHKVEFEVDCASDVPLADAVTTVQTFAHPNHPATLPNETLTIETVFRRAGFDVTRSGAGNTVPINLSGPNNRWSDTEMHDAMQVYWSKFANIPQWAMWIFLASLHESGTGLGGIMFDDIGPNHRQGTAIFEEAFISQPPNGDPAPAAWVQRMRFWTAVHETGHAFNLAHSWQKALGTPWIPLVNEPEARSFMNYPYNVAGGQAAFFANFAYRFTDPELLFMRHAPERFVQMGNAAWFDHHGFRQANRAENPTFTLEVRSKRIKPSFEFLEPVMLELKLSNRSERPQVVADDILSSRENLTVVIKREGHPARQLRPYAQYCSKTKGVTLKPGEAIYDPLFASAGVNGWEIAEPGNYVIQIALHLDDEDVVSNPLRIRVAAPAGEEDTRLAHDFFNPDVARVLNFDGSRFDSFQPAMDTLREVAERLEDSRAATHARVAIGSCLALDYKRLIIDGESTQLCTAQSIGAVIKAEKADADEARSELSAALTGKPAETSQVAETLGNIEYRAYVDYFSEWLNSQGETQGAYDLQDSLLATLTDRGVALNRVVEEVKRKRDSFAKRRTAGRN